MTRLLPLLLLACTAGAPDPIGCRDEGDCPGISICNTDSECEAVECLSSTQCGLEAFCDTTAFACTPGCEFNTDCPSNATCSTDLGVCEVSQCADSQLDCHFGEVCNQDRGACEPDEALCAPCTGDGFSTCRQDYGGQCQWFSGASYCLTPCSPFTDPAKIPRGFACLDFDPSNEERFLLYGDCAEVDLWRNPPEDEDTGR